MDNFDSASLRRETERAMRVPLGLASPLWLAFGAAASAGVAWWWVSRLGRPLNIEAKLATVPAAPKPVLDVAPAKTPKAPKAPKAPVTKFAPVEAPPVVLPDDDLTVLVGIGPKLAASLAERGVTRFAQLAAWTADELAAIDTALNLRGRAHRDDWVGQAKAFATKG
jgi:predicted flap endonuclease-1-like 5' DNA nuclease